MKIDTGLLDQRFELMGMRDAGERIARAFENDKIQYYIVGERWDPGNAALLVERGSLMQDVVQAAFSESSSAWQLKWLDALRRDPKLFTTLIAGAVLKQDNTFDPRVIRVASLTDPQRRGIHRYLHGYLSDLPTTPMIDVRKTPPAQLKSPTIVVATGSVMGVYSRPTLSSAVAVVPTEQTYVVRGDRPLGSGGSAPPANAKAAAGKKRGAHSARQARGRVSEFSAFPRLTVKSPATRERPLPFVAGFSETADPSAQEQTRIKIKAAIGTLLVVASAEGARIEEPSFAQLPLDLKAEHPFVAHVVGDAEKVVLRLQYFFGNNLVGSMVKNVALTGTPALALPTIGAELARLRIDPSAAQVDLILIVENSVPGEASWRALVPSTGTISPLFPVKLGDPAKFAKELAGIRGHYGDRGLPALEQLYFTGQVIADLIPDGILKDLVPALKGSQPPSILLMTDQPFVPWELARFGPRMLGRKEPGFLGEVARIGRWWTAAALSAPRSQRRIQHLSALAATQYNGARGLQPLPHALEERQWLVDEYRAERFEATLPEVEEWLSKQPRPIGHLGHIALHGYSDVQDDAQGLVLGDGKVLTPGLLAGQFYEGDTPRFEAVFLNACQVGTAGERLSRIAGFPGALLRAGAAALVAPLWEVDDSVAGLVAKGFYKRVLTQKLEVAEAMRQLRLGIDPKSITPASYIYYGHPCLQLTL